MSEETFDIIIVRAPADTSWPSARTQGKKVCLIERAHLGGVCLNEGCVPSKTLLYSSKLSTKRPTARSMGVYVDNPASSSKMPWPARRR